MKKSAWVGFVFFVAMILALYGSFVVGDLKTWFKTPNHLTVHFPDARGLSKSADVRVDGVLMGKVERLDLDPKEGVLALLRLDQPIELYADFKIVVESTSVLGGSNVSITRGTKAPKRNLQEILEGSAQPGIEAIGGLVDENRENVRELIRHLKDVAQTLKEGKGTIPQLLNSPKLHDELVATTTEARQAIAEVKGEVKRLGDNLAKITDQVDKGKGPLGALLNDEKWKKSIESTIHNVEDASKGVKDLTDKLNKNEGTLGKFINDKEMAKSFERTLRNVEETSESLKNVTRKFEDGEGTIGKLIQDDELYEQARKAVKDMNTVLGKVATTRVEVVAESKLYDESEVAITKLGIRISPSEDKYFFVGAAFMGLSKDGEVLFKNMITDNDDDTVIKPEIQVAYRVPWFLDRAITVRGGMIEGKPGAALDVAWSDWGFVHHPIQFSLEGRDAYSDIQDEDIDENIDGAMWRFYVKAPLWTRKDTWYELLLSTLTVYGGISRIGEDPEFIVGIGIEWPDDDFRTLVSLIGLAR